MAKKVSQEKCPLAIPDGYVGITGQFLLVFLLLVKLVYGGRQSAPATMKQPVSLPWRGYRCSRN